MIIDYKQRKSSINISYIDKNNQIAIDYIYLPDGYYNYSECDEFDPEKIQHLKSFKGSSIKKVSDKYFKHHNINEFFSYDIPLNYSQYTEKIFALREPNPFSSDIEVLPTDRYGYSGPKEALNPITSIQICDKNLGILCYLVKNETHPEFNHFDYEYINGILREQLGIHYNDSIKYVLKVFDTEKEMLETFVDNINKYFHLLMGWNFYQYDWDYILNRCRNIGVSIEDSSPIHSLSKKRIEISDSISIDLELPTHRVITDYMLLFQDSLIYNNLGSYSLDSVSKTILDIGKVEYEGNLRKLYNDDYLRFIAYALIDPLLVMLIHKKTNLLTVDFFQSYYTGVPYNRLSQNSISEALIYKELKKDNIFLLESEKNTVIKRKYQGGYVKNPTKKILQAVMGFDYSAEYPNCIITNGISPDGKIDSIKVNEQGLPINPIEKAKWEKYRAQGCCLVPLGRIYDISKDTLYVRIEKGLIAERAIFKSHMEDIYLNVIPKIEKQIKLLQ